MNSKVGVLGAAVFSMIFASSATAAWDAIPVDQKYFPITTWEQRFSTQPDVLATASIDDAIYACDDIVGETGYCVVQITDTASRVPLYIDRSRTKIVGFEGMKPLLGQAYENTISVMGNTKHIVIEGIEFKGQFTEWDDSYGIVISGESIDGVVVRNNHIHHYESWDNAHAIAVFGSGSAGRTSVRHVLIENNLVHDMKTGSSESIVVNGNVQRWAIVNNTVKDINNIAIDAIGGEGTAPTRVLSSGRTVPGVQDRARYGFIIGNHVENLSTVSNPAYGNEVSWAAAIYVDGGSRIKIEGNTVVNAPWAYEVGAENCLTTSHVSVLNNSATGSYYGDLLLGGYSEVGYKADANINCDPHQSIDVSEGHGYVSRVRVEGNSFESSNATQDRILPQFRLRGAVVLEAGVEAVNTHRNGNAPGDQNAILTQEP